MFRLQTATGKIQHGDLDQFPESAVAAKWNSTPWERTTGPEEESECQDETEDRRLSDGILLLTAPLLRSPRRTWALWPTEWVS